MAVFATEMAHSWGWHVSGLEKSLPTFLQNPASQADTRELSAPVQTYTASAEAFATGEHARHVRAVAFQKEPVAQSPPWLLVEPSLDTSAELHDGESDANSEQLAHPVNTKDPPSLVHVAEGDFPLTASRNPTPQPTLPRP